MAHQVPDTIMPDSLVAGDYWTWRVPVITNYPTGDSWTLSYGFVGPGQFDSADTGWTITNESAGTRLVTVAKANTGVTAGTYRWRAYVNLAASSERYQVADGWVEVQPNVIGQAAAAKTHAQTMYDLCTTALEGRLTTQEESYSVGGRSISKMPIAELNRLRGMYAALVWRERNPGKALPSAQIAFRPTGHADDA